MGKKWITVVPSMLTMLSLFFGFIVIISCIKIIYLFVQYSTVEAANMAEYYFSLSTKLIIICGLLDFFDGRLARKLKTDSNIGKSLDSLSDMTVFGVVPGVFFYTYTLYVQNTLSLGYFQISSNFTWLMHPLVIIMASFLYLLAASIRLAKFEENEDVLPGVFMGLPTTFSGPLTIVLMTYPYHEELIGTFFGDSGFLLSLIDYEALKWLIHYEVIFFIHVLLGMMMMVRIPYLNFGKALSMIPRKIRNTVIILLIIMLALASKQLILILAILYIIHPFFLNVREVVLKGNKKV